MKNKDKKTEPKIVKKSSIILAWIILIILIISATLLTYIKFFGPNENLEEHPIDNTTNSDNTTTSTSLEQIISNFNNKASSEEYQQKGITMNAKLTENVLTIEYKTTISNIYQFIFYTPSLTITIDNTVNTQEFYDVYKTLVYAVQESLGNTNNIDTYIDNFINNNQEVDGLSKEIIDNSTKYSIDTTKIINSVAKGEVVDEFITEKSPLEPSDEVIEPNNEINNTEGAE